VQQRRYAHISVTVEPGSRASSPNLQCAFQATSSLSLLSAQCFDSTLAPCLNCLWWVLVCPDAYGTS
jgi:hypothetical protein